MTRLEKLFRDIDEAYGEQGEYGFDPIPFVQDYLRERNDFVAERLLAEQATIATAVANEFDNAEVAEGTDGRADDDTNVFVEVFGRNPVQELDQMITTLRVRDGGA